jgi:hypothetical protein
MVLEIPEQRVPARGCAIVSKFDTGNEELVAGAFCTTHMAQAWLTRSPVLGYPPIRRT